VKIECLGKELFKRIKEERFVLTSAQQEKIGKMDKGKREIFLLFTYT
jgi:hypothetical protein